MVGDHSSNIEILELVDQLPITLTQHPYWRWCLWGGLIASVVLSWLVCKLWIKYASRPLTASQQLEALLKKLQAQLKQHGEQLQHPEQQRAFYFALTGQLKNYLEARTGLNINDKSDEELVALWPQLRNLTPSMQQEAIELFAQAQQVRFAGRSLPPERLAQDLERIRLFWKALNSPTRKQS